MKKPHAAVYEGKRRQIEFPWYRTVKTAIERYLPMVCKNQIDNSYPCQNCRAKALQTHWRHNEMGPPPADLAPLPHWFLPSLSNEDTGSKISPIKGAPPTYDYIYTLRTNTQLFNLDTYVLSATIPFSGHFYYSGCNKSRNRLVEFLFLPNGSLNEVCQYCFENSELGTWNVQRCMAHFLVVSKVWYLCHSASCYENRVIFGPKTMFLHHNLLTFEDIENRGPRQDAPCEAAYFTYQALNYLINIGGLNWPVRLKNHRFLMWQGHYHTDI